MVASMVVSLGFSAVTMVTSKVSNFPRTLLIARWRTWKEISE